MADDKETRCWVSDQLMNLLGNNNPTTVLFVIELGKTRVAGNLISQLEDFGFPVSQDTETFARELQRRLPHKTTGLSAYQKAEIESAVLARKQQQYQLLDADDDEVKDALRVAAEQRQGKLDKKEERRHKLNKRLRRKSDEDVDEAEEAVIKRGWSRRAGLGSDAIS